MNTITILTIVHVIVAVLLMAAILVQNKGAGLSEAFGGGNAPSRSTKRGPEKFIFYATITLAVIFVGLGVANLFIQ